MKKLTLLLLALTVGCMGCVQAPAPTQAPTAPPTTAPTQPPQTLPPETEPPQTLPPETEPTDPAPKAPAALPSLYRAECQEYLTLWKSVKYGGVLGRVNAGETVTVLGWEEGYALVQQGEQLGYVAANYLRPAEDSYWSDCLQIVQLQETYSYTQMLEDITALAKTYPASTKLTTIGKSEEGRLLPVLILGDRQAKYQVLIQGAMHAREYFNSNLLLAMAEYWLSRGMVGLEDVCFHIIPMVNPDGVTLVQKGSLNTAQTDIYREDVRRGRTDLRGDEYIRAWKANALGIDLNRNFPAGWEPINGPSTPSSMRYKGSEPFCAAETQALRRYTLAQEWDVTLSYHSAGCVLYYEFGTHSANAASLELAEVVRAVTGYGLRSSSTVEGGGYKDWALDTLGIPSLTVETGYGNCPLVNREIWSIFPRNINVFLAVAQWLKS